MKPGYKTTEYWTLIAFSAVVFALAVFTLLKRPEHFPIVFVAVETALAAGIAYGRSRHTLKKQNGGGG